MRRGGISHTLVAPLLVLVALGGPGCRKRVSKPPATVRASQALGRVGPMVDGRFNPLGVVVAGDRLLILSGGCPDERADLDSSGSAELFDDAAGAFFEVGPPVVPRLGQALVGLSDGDALVLGGWSKGALLATCERYVAAEGVFKALPAHLTAPRNQGGALLLPDGQVLLWGGFGSDGKPFLQVERVDPCTGQGAPAGTLLAPRIRAQATLLRDGTVLFTGGEGFQGAERLDLKTGKSHAVAGGQPGRQGHGALGLPDGRVLIFGGERRDPRTGQVQAEVAVEAFDPRTEAFTPAGALTSGRVRPAWTLTGGQLLLAGGSLDGVPLSTTEHLDLVTGMARSGAPTFVPRGDDRLLPLPGGRALLFGSGVFVAERVE